MFDFDAGKFLIIGIVALVVIGPKELPRVLRQVGQMVGRVRRMAAEFQGQFMDAMKEADIEAIREDLKKIGNDAEISAHFDPARDIQRELTATLEAPAIAAEVPAMTDLPAAAIGGFVLPPPVQETHETIAIADPGAVPIAAMEAETVTVAAPSESEPVATEPGLAMNGNSVFSEPRKRRIIVPKRRVVSRTHTVSDRTTFGRARSVSLRDQESAGR